MKLQVKFKTPGFADCNIEIQAKGFLVASIYWANTNGPLPEWSLLAVFPISPSGTGSYAFDGHRAILCHAPLLAHNPHRNSGSAYYHGNDALQSILDSYTHIIFVSGHTHFSPNTHQGNVDYVPGKHTIYIDDGSIVPTELTGESLMPSEWHDGVIAELVLFDHAVEIKYHSIHTGKMFPRGYYCFQV